LNFAYFTYLKRRRSVQVQEEDKEKEIGAG